MMNKTCKAKRSRNLVIRKKYLNKLQLRFITFLVVTYRILSILYTSQDVIFTISIQSVKIKGIVTSHPVLHAMSKHVQIPKNM